MQSVVSDVVQFCKGKLLSEETEVNSEYSLWKNFVSSNILSENDVLFGGSDRRAVEFWFNQAVTKDKDKLLSYLNKHLSNKTYVVGEKLTIADIGLYVSLFISMKQEWSESQRLKFADVWRWFDLIQHTLPSRNSLDLVEFCRSPRTEELGQFVEKKLKINDNEANIVQDKEPKKDKASEIDKSQQVSVETNESSEEDISRLDIRVGKILSAEKHPNADTLYVEKIDVGESSPRTVCSGLVKYIENPQDLIGTCIVLCNLKPVNMRGIKSEAMILCATSKDGTHVELVKPPEDTLIGERVVFLGHDGQPDSVLNPKKKVFEKIQPYFSTTDDCIAVWKDVPFNTSKGFCRVQRIQGGTIR
eukprot:jgi/Galph1/5090/GphlegSOOS_G3732.1